MPIYRDKTELLGTPTITGSVGISGIPAVTGTIGISGIPTVSLSSNQVTSSITGSVSVEVTNGINVTGTVDIGNTPTVYLGGVPSVNATVTGSVSITGTPTVTLSSNAVTASIVGTVTTQATGTTIVGFASAPAVTIANATSSYEGNTILVGKLTGSSVIATGIREALITYVTGAEAVQVSSLPAITGTVAIEGVTAISGNLPITGTVDTGFDAYSLPNSLQAVLVKITGSTTSVDAQYVTGTVSIGVNKYALGDGSALVVKLTGSTTSTDAQYVTGAVTIGADSYSLPSGNALLVKITGSTTSNDAQYVTGNVTVTTSDENPLIVKNKTPTTVTRAAFSSYGGPGTASIDWTSTASANVSGTFIIANSSSARSGLTFTNITDKNLFIAFGDTDFPEKNGFGLNSTASAPFSFAYILYPSGTYFADPSFVGAKHSGFFVSSSNIDVSLTAFAT